MAEKDVLKKFINGLKEINKLVEDDKIKTELKDIESNLNKRLSNVNKTTKKSTKKTKK